MDEWPKSFATPVIIQGLDEMDSAGRAAFLEVIEARMKQAENHMMSLIDRDIYGPLDPNWKPTPITRWRAFWRILPYRWYWLRRWLAVHVLRVDIHDDDGDD